MECLIDYIGLRGCTSTTPDSGYYINSLPGMNLEMIDMIADSEQKTYAGVWEDIQLRAARRFESDVTSHLLKRYAINRISKSVNLLRKIDTVNNQSLVATKYRGFLAELVQASSNNLVNSVYQVFNFQSISLYRPAATIAVNLKFFDLVTGSVLYSTVIPAGGPGWTTVNISRRIFAYRLAVVYDSTLVASTFQDITDLDLNGDCNSCGYLRLKGIESDSLSSSLTDDDLTKSSNIFGLSAVFTVECSYYALVCANKFHFLDAWWYLLGVETLDERVFSPRKNVFTTIDADRGKRLRAHYQVEYENKISLACETISLDLSDVCLDCNEPYQVREGIP
jgi:hypothetical protein